MSELINIRDNRATIRWKLLTSASALALTVCISSANAAKADDTDQPLIWIELGGQLEHITGQGAPFAPDFLSKFATAPILQEKVTPLQAQRPPTFSFGEEGKISFQPEGSDWLFSAAIRYGRSSNVRHVDHQTNGIHHGTYVGGAVFPATIFGTENFADTKAPHRESHAIVDFLVGRDVGLGMFGKDSSSSLSLGVRIAQFTSKASVDFRARPDLQFKYYPSAHAPSRYVFPFFHTYHATGHASRSFRGLGPAVSWNSSMPFAGNQQDGEVMFDWGLNAALLFGKQKARVQHQESAHYQSYLGRLHTTRYTSVYHHSGEGHGNTRNVTVPNVGGFAGLSWRVQDFKVSMGYRADFFFGAMDTGIDAAKKSNLAFNGPYASISVGLGD